MSLFSEDLALTCRRVFVFLLLFLFHALAAGPCIDLSVMTPDLIAQNSRQLARVPRGLLVQNFPSARRSLSLFPCREN